LGWLEATLSDHDKNIMNEKKMDKEKIIKLWGNLGPSDIGKLQEWQQNSCHSVSVPKGTSEISFSFEDSSTTMGTK